jgi:hypothetical protein
MVKLPLRAGAVDRSVWSIAAPLVRVAELLRVDLADVTEAAERVASGPVTVGAPAGPGRRPGGVAGRSRPSGPTPHPCRPAGRGVRSRRRFEALGGYPTRSQAEAALADALARRSHGLALDSAKLTVDQDLDRWLTHIRTSLRARTVARYAALLRATSDPISAPDRSSN